MVYIPFFLAFIISVIIMPVIIKYAKKHKIVDQPCKRKVHKKPIPLLGGLGILIAFIIPLFIFTTINLKTVMIVLCLCSITLLGILDDIYDIKANRKLAVQLICSGVAVISGVRIDLGEFVFSNSIVAETIDVIISFLWIVGIINAINLIDGLDGLAAGVSFISAIGFLVVGIMVNDRFIIMMSSLLAGAVLGFLFYNFYPAKIFMGDAGSTLLGFSLAIISLHVPKYSVNKASLYVPILILAVPIFETGVSILRRSLKKRNIFEADRGHTHYKLMDMGFSQKGTVGIIYLVSLFSVILGLAVYKSRQYKLGIVFIVIYILYGVGSSVKEAYFVEPLGQLAVSKEDKADIKLLRSKRRKRHID